ncbi:MAG: hypothetical protein OK455_03485 [Thaumarchaeota archaeon]|nr:hypothetical protein [Nitrososphaerota archaeon]
MTLFPNMRTSSTVEEASATDSGLTLSVFKATKRRKWDHFADFTIRCWRKGIGEYAIQVYCGVTIIELGKEETRFGRDEIERTLMEYRSLGITVSETTRYRRGIRQLGEKEDEVVSRRYVEFSFRVASVAQRFDHVEAGSTVDEIGELALTRLKAIRKICESDEGLSGVALKKGGSRPGRGSGGSRVNLQTPRPEVT